MTRIKRLYTLTLTAMLAGPLAGCAVYGNSGSADYPGDAKTTADVRALFEQHAALNGRNVLDVRTRNHVVYLYGLVDTEMERRMAESAALEATGVEKVVNLIGVNNS